MATNSSQKLNRRGVATLEFVMALPLLFVLMICILWEGHWLIGQAEVIVEARNNTWKKRFDNLADNPLSFPILPDYNLPVLYHKDADYAHEKASTKVDITPAFNAIPGPEAANFLLAGSWDSQAMPLDKPPDFVLMGKAAPIGAFGNVLGLASSLDDPLGLLGMVTSAKNEGARTSETRSHPTNLRLAKANPATIRVPASSPGVAIPRAEKRPNRPSRTPRRTSKTARKLSSSDSRRFVPRRTWV